MIKKALLVVAVLFAGNVCLVSAQGTTVAVKKIGHARIFEIRERIEGQRARINEGVAANSLTAGEAQACRAVLTNVETQMTAEHEANGTKKIMTRDRYEAYNVSLDMNSAVIHEEKGSYYYYDSYYDQHTY